MCEKKKDFFLKQNGWSIKEIIDYKDKIKVVESSKYIPNMFLLELDPPKIPADVATSNRLFLIGSGLLNEVQLHYILDT